MTRTIRPMGMFGVLALVMALVVIKLDQVRAQATQLDVGSSLVVIVSVRSGTRALSFNTVRDIFMGVPTYVKAGEPYVPMAHPVRSPLRTAFDQQFLGLDPDAVGRFWIDQRIRARAMPPRTIPSLDILRRAVAALPNAISYVRASELQPGLVPVKIDGVDFRSPQYRFHMAQLLREGLESQRARF